ncbi:MAG: hypothetical protein MJ145_02615 [Clostridia bacterium]|nr:hypothetical protein [Clostridia bacterium]
MKYTRLAEYVLQMDTYKDLDYAFAEESYWNIFGKGGCTACVKSLPNGDTIVGRNMDLYYSNKPAYIVRTDVEGEYKTLGFAYSYLSGPDYKEVLSNGLSEEDIKKIPFTCCDIINEHGLYMEINMRNGEFNEDGSSVYLCTGTNPKAKKRVCSLSLQRHVVNHCKNIDEALEYINNELNIYTPFNENLPWNFCFILAEPGGRHGLLEIAENKISWLEGQDAQTNFYITKEFADKEQLKCGLGRYDYVMDKLNSINNEDDMFKMMESIQYSNIYRPDPVCDIRTEWVGVKPHWTTDYVLLEENRAEIEEMIDHDMKKFASLSREELMDGGTFWESVFTVVANCEKRSLMLRCFEDESKTFNLEL